MLLLARRSRDCQLRKILHKHFLYWGQYIWLYRRFYRFALGNEATYHHLSILHFWSDGSAAPHLVHSPLWDDTTLSKLVTSSLWDDQKRPAHGYTKWTSWVRDGWDTIFNALCKWQPNTLSYVWLNWCDISIKVIDGQISSYPLSCERSKIYIIKLCDNRNLKVWEATCDIVVKFKIQMKFNDLIEIKIEVH